MVTAAALLGYAVVAAWCVPALLAPLTRRGVSARAGLAAWLTAMASVLLAAGAATEFSLQTVAADWSGLTRDLCRSVVGQACTPEIYRSVLYQAGVTVLAVVSALAAVTAAWRWGRRVQRSAARTRSHARTALLVGRVIPGQEAIADPAGADPAPVTAGSARSAGTHVRGTRAVVLDDPRPAAYCVAGRPAAIIVTSGALDVLDPPQLDAVLAHERAHLSHRHHWLALLTGGLAAVLPGVPLFTRGSAEVGRLAEMCADDAAARRAGRATLAAALLAIATGARFPVTRLAPGAAGQARPEPSGVPAPGLAAAAYAVPARVERMLRRPGTAVAVTVAAALTACSALLAAAPAALALLAR